MKKARPTILFVCVENSCRSQMAEGFARTLGKDAVEVWSAGSKPSGNINPTAKELMREKGIELAGQRSKGLEELPRISWDYIVAMGCGDRCPAVTTRRRIEWDIPDPKALPLDEFRKVRDSIEDHVAGLLRPVLGGGHEPISHRSASRQGRT